MTFSLENPPLMQTEDGRALSEYIQRQMLLVIDSFNARHDWEDAEPFLGKPQDAMLRWFYNGAPGNNSGPGYYYYLRPNWLYLGAAEILSYGESISGTGNVWDDLNATDFTGHQYAGVDGCATTALSLKTNAIVTFGHNLIAYIWDGPKGVCVGVGGNYLATSDDLSPIGTGDHDILSNRDAVDSHPQAAIGGRLAAATLEADQAQQDADLQGHISAGTAHTMGQISGLIADQSRQDADLAAHEALTNNPHQTAHEALTGDIGTNTHTQIDGHIADTNNPHAVTHDQLSDVDPLPDPHPIYSKKLPGMFLGGQPSNFTWNTTDSKLQNYTRSAQWNWPDDDDIDPTGGNITIPNDGLYTFTAHVLGDQENDNKEEWGELKIDVVGGLDPGRTRVDILEIPTDKTRGRCLQATWTRPAYAGEVYSLWMWASTGLGTFSVEAVSFEVIMIAEIGELNE